MMKLAMAALVGILAIMSLAACGGGGDSIEARAEGLADAMNDLDWRRVYNFCPPDWRENNDYEDFRGEIEDAEEDAALDEGSLKLSVTDIEVESGGEAATVSYKVEAELAGISDTFSQEARWVKVGDQWYFGECDS